MPSRMNRRMLRKIKNGAFLALSLIATLTGLACLAAILWTLISHGMAGHVLRIFHADDAAARQPGRLAQRAVRQRA